MPNHTNAVSRHCRDLDPSYEMNINVDQLLTLILGTYEIKARESRNSRNEILQEQSAATVNQGF